MDCGAHEKINNSMKINVVLCFLKVCNHVVFVDGGFVSHGDGD